MCAYLYCVSILGQGPHTAYRSTPLQLPKQVDQTRQESIHEYQTSYQRVVSADHGFLQEIESLSERKQSMKLREPEQSNMGFGCFDFSFHLGA